FPRSGTNFIRCPSSADCIVGMSRIFGIDLGTTNSLIALMEGKTPRVLAGPANTGALVPSVVAIAPDGEVSVGDSAIEKEPRLADDNRGPIAHNGPIAAPAYSGGESGAVIRSIKRYMGLGGDEVASEERKRYAFTDFSGPVVRFQIGQRSFTPAQISAEIL